MTKTTCIARDEVGQVGQMSHGWVSRIKHVVTWLDDWIRIKGNRGDWLIPIKVAPDLPTTATQMDLKCPNLVCDGHMTWYIAKNIQNKPLKHILMALCWNIQNILDDSWFGTLWSHDLVHFDHIWHCPNPGHRCHISLVHLKYSRHMLVWYVVSSLSQN